MAIFDDVINNNPAYSANFVGYTGNPPTNESEYVALKCWNDFSIAPTWEEIQQQIDFTKWKNSRANAYPSIADQLDTLYHGGYDAWKASIEAVKNQYPKP